MFEDLPDVSEGDLLSAEAENRLRRAANRTIGGAGFYADSGGTAQYQLPRLDPRYPLRFQPDFDVPAYGVVKLTGDAKVLGDTVILSATQATEDSEENTAINGPWAVKTDAYGCCTLANHIPVLALYDDTTTPAVGDDIGPVADSTSLLVDNTGYRVLAVVVDRGLVLVRQATVSVAAAVFGKAKWIEFELAEDLMGGYAIVDIINFHDGTDPDPTPNPDAHAAILTTRTDDDTGVVTFAVYGILTARGGNTTGTITAAGHGLVAGDRADVFWSGGARDHVLVGTVSGDNVPISSGTGDNLPAEITAVLITESFVGPLVPYDHGLVVYDYADVFWVVDEVNYSRKRMLVTVVSGNQVTLDEETDVTYGDDLPAVNSDVAVLKSFSVWNTGGRYSGLHQPTRSSRGSARFSSAKPAYTTAGPPRPSVPEQKEDRYYVDDMECQIPQS